MPRSPARKLRSSRPKKKQKKTKKNAILIEETEVRDQRLHDDEALIGRSPFHKVDRGATKQKITNKITHGNVFFFESAKSKTNETR